MPPKLIDPGDPKGFQRQGGIFIPGEQLPVEKKSVIETIKSIITPVKRLLTPGGREEGEDPTLTIAKPFNHRQRRWHRRYATRLQRHNARVDARRELRLDQATFGFSSQKYSDGKIVRFDSTGKPMSVILRPPTIHIRPNIGYLEVNGPKQLRKSDVQLRFEAASQVGEDGKRHHLKAAMEPRIDHLGKIRPPKRLRGSWVPGPAQRGEKTKVTA